MTKEKNIFEFGNFGVCIKTKDHTVLFQNGICKETCGDLKEKKCELCRGMMLTPTETNPFPLLSSGEVLAGRNQSISNCHCDVFRFSDENNKELTVFIPIKGRLKVYCEKFEDLQFTPREVEIGILLLEKISNIEIAEKLFISKSTLKTHLNHMYQKFPELKKVRFEKQSDSATA